MRDQLAEYLALRRALGYRLERPEKLLKQFLEHLERGGETVVTVASAGLGSLMLLLCASRVLGRLVLGEPGAVFVQESEVADVAVFDA